MKEIIWKIIEFMTPKECASCGLWHKTKTCKFGTLLFLAMIACSGISNAEIKRGLVERTLEIDTSTNTARNGKWVGNYIYGFSKDTIAYNVSCEIIYGTTKPTAAEEKATVIEWGLSRNVTARAKHFFDVICKEYRVQKNTAKSFSVTLPDLE